MSIHTILSQMEGQVFGHGGEVIEISIYRKDGKILSIPYNQVKTGLETFATRIVEEAKKEERKRIRVAIEKRYKDYGYDDGDGGNAFEAIEEIKTFNRR